MRRRWLTSARLGAAGLIAALLAAGCAARDPHLATAADLEPLIRGQGLEPADIVVPFAIDEPMAQWARSAVPQVGSAHEKLQGLLRALISSRGLGLTYEADLTVSASEAFARRRANCVSFTNLFVGLSRALGLPVYFVLVEDVQKFTKEGDLVVVSDHMTAGYGEAHQRLILDFTPEQTAEYRSIRELSDLTAIAMFYSNRGAALLRTGDSTPSIPWLRTAIALDPELAGGWTNLGVALRRTGDLTEAEAAYRRALEADPATIPAYQNLAALLRLRGKEREAMDLLALTNRRDNRNPFNFLDLGDVSLRHGRLEEAERYYRKALRLGSDGPEPYAALGVLRLAAGDSDQARRWLRRAEGRDPQNPRVQQLKRMLRGDKKPPFQITQRRSAD